MHQDMIDFDDLLDDFIKEEEEAKTPEPQEEQETEEAEEINSEKEETEQEIEEEFEEEAHEQEIEESPEEDNVPIEGYFNFLKEYGVLDLDEDFNFDGSPEALEKALETTKKNVAIKVSQAIWENLPDDFKPLLEYGLNGGRSLQEYLKAYSPVDFEDVDLSDEDNQKAIIREYYKQTTKKNEEQIDRMINRLESLGGLEEEALDAVNYLKEFKEQAKQQLIEKAQQEEQQRLEQVKKEVETLRNSIKSTNLDDTRKRRLEGFMLTPIKEGGRTTTYFDQALNQVLSNPEHLVQLADILADYHPSKGIDLKRIETKIKTQANKSFKQLLNESINNSKPTGTSTKRKVKEDFDWDGFLNS